MCRKMYLYVIRSWYTESGCVSRKAEREKLCVASMSQATEKMRDSVCHREARESRQIKQTRRVSQQTKCVCVKYKARLTHAGKRV